MDVKIMSKFKTKSSGVERHILIQEGGGRNLEEEHNKITLKQNKILTIQEDFSLMFKDSVKEILSHIENYTCSLECQLCHKKIEDTMTPNYFHLYPEKQSIFIIFHFLCALKKKCCL